MFRKINNKPTNNTLYSEFRSGEEIQYNLRSRGLWLLSHLMLYPHLPIFAVLTSVGSNIAYSAIQVLVGRGFDLLSAPGWLTSQLVALALLIAGSAILQGFTNLVRNLSFEVLAQRIERDARAELLVSLLGKSQAFHSRQKVGDIMARATNDVHFMNLMFSPGVMLIMDSVLTVAVPMIAISVINWQLLLVPVVFIVFMIITIRAYNKKINPATQEQRSSFGSLNGTLADALEGIETVKGNLGEANEVATFLIGAGKLKKLFIRIAMIQAKYWPLLVFAIAWGLGFLHALILWRQGTISIGQVVAYMLLFNVFRFATFISMYSFNLFQMGLSSAGRVLETIKATTDLDENKSGHSARINGKIEFVNVSFSYSRYCSEGITTPPLTKGVDVKESATLRNISFTVEAGQTIAIVGRTGSGKSTLVRLINRIYDPLEGAVLIDGIDLRNWNLESLRSQIATIEQDIFLYSKPIAWNIGFGREGATQAEIEEAAKAAQAHEFISSFKNGYETEIGERGITLSGGQKQRVAIARTFLADPRILILDDSTSAIDSKTEDEIKNAIQLASKGRTTFLITHRLSMIRAADCIVLLEGGHLAELGSHEELLSSSPDYRHLFVKE